MLTTKDFGEFIQKIRKEANLTQAELAAASGLGERFVRELEKGKPTCQLEKALLVARMLGITITLTSPPNQEEE